MPLPSIILLLLHSAMTNLHLFSPALLAAAPSHSATLTPPHLPFLITFTLFSFWQNEMGHSAAAAFQHSPHADIPLHKQRLIACVRECERVSVCVPGIPKRLCFSPSYFVVRYKVNSRVLLSCLIGI